MKKDFSKNILKYWYLNTFSIILGSLLMFSKGEGIKYLKEGREKREHLGESTACTPQTCIHKPCSRVISLNCSQLSCSPLKVLILVTFKNATFCRDKKLKYWCTFSTLPPTKQTVRRTDRSAYGGGRETSDPGTAEKVQRQGWSLTGGTGRGAGGTADSGRF